MFRTLTLTL
jgi:hypothetical protein